MAANALLTARMTTTIEVAFKIGDVNTGSNGLVAGATWVIPGQVFCQTARRKEGHDPQRTGGPHCDPVYDALAVCPAEFDNCDGRKRTADNVVLRGPHPRFRPRCERIDRPAQRGNQRVHIPMPICPAGMESYRYRSRRCSPLPGQPDPRSRRGRRTRSQAIHRGAPRAASPSQRGQHIAPKSTSVVQRRR